MSKQRCTRRRFLRRAAAAGGLAALPQWIPGRALGADGSVPPSERVAMGFIGVGSHGIGRNLNMFLRQPDAQPVALCDVDSRCVAQAVQVCQRSLGEKFTCPTTGDWRELLARRDVDAVMISTPDHWHVPIAIAAIRAGKDVICEKPTLTVAEGQALVKAVRQYAAVFQLSTEDRSLAVYHRMAELVRNGRIDRLQRILVGLPGGSPANPPVKPEPPPKEIDYEMWLGPAPWAPYVPGRLPYHWRWIADYSGGMLADWGAHLLDTAQWANDTERTGPVEVEGKGTRYTGGLYDTFYDFHLRYRYANGVEMTVDSGAVSLRFEGTGGWVGNNGWIGSVEASSPEILRSVIGPGETRLFTCPGGEHRNFLDCFKTRRDPYFAVEIGHRCCSVCHLGNIALELRRKLRWDPQTERFPDAPDANRLLSRAMREPWTL